jgi:DNA-binding NtrC family response regulator
MAAQPTSDHPLVLGHSPAIRRALSVARRFADSSLSILLVGATGTGKEVFARQIHDWSGRAGRFVDVDCGALPRDLLEGLLFGRRRGAFTGAVENAAGLVESAAHGTLFLDELASLPPSGQNKLLRVLETGRVRRLGETESRAVDFRLLGAAQDDIGHRVETGEFRHDLLQRVAGAVITLPTLAERGEDIIPLARAFAAAANVRIDPDAERTLLGWDWPGNVRELRATVVRAAVLAVDGSITPRTLAESRRLGPSLLLARLFEGPSHRSAGLDLLLAYERNGRNAQRAAHALGIGRATFFRRLRAAGISLRRDG